MIRWGGVWYGSRTDVMNNQFKNMWPLAPTIKFLMDCMKENDEFAPLRFKQHKKARGLFTQMVHYLKV